MATNVITNGALYINGNSHVGQCKEAKLPKLKQKLANVLGLGMGGEVAYPSGVMEKMEATFSMMSFYPSAMMAAGDPFTGAFIQLRVPMATYQGANRLVTTPLIHELTGFFNTFDPGGYKPGDNADFELEFQAHSYKCTAAGVVVVEFDAVNNVHKSGDKDLALLANIILGL